jgi:hypothetical protein
MKQLLFYLLVVFLAIHPLASFACETQKKAIPEVLQYIQKVNTDLAYIAAVTHANKC